MIPITAESPEIRNLQLEKIVVYLLRNGWRKLSHPNSSLTVFEGFADDSGNPIQLVLPTSLEFWDSLMLIAKAINLLAAIEECQPRSILEKIDLQDNIADFNHAKEIIKSSEPESLQSYLPYLQKPEANTHNRLSADYVSEERWYEGLAQLQASLDYYRQTDNLERRADVLNQIARVQLLLGNWDKARMLYRDALRLYTHLGKKEGIANCHLALGRIMLHLNYTEDAQKELENASVLFDECGLSQRQAEAQEVLQVVSQFKSKQAIKI
jgi:tetratricopeptide (TPR) repeat protein